MREKEAGKRYQIELFAGLTIYVVLLVTAIKFGQNIPNGSVRTALMVSPMLGFGLVMWAIVRSFGRMDEYIHQRSLQAIAIAAGVTAGWTFTYGFLEIAGYPKLSMFTVWPVMGFTWAGTNLIRKFSNR
jgi:hypothetical protein